jgi:hypothetical protein
VLQEGGGRVGKTKTVQHEADLTDAHIEAIVLHDGLDPFVLRRR